MNRERIDDLWDRFLAEEPLSPEEERELLEALTSSAELREELLDEEQIERTLAALGRSSADAQEFVNSFTHQSTLEGDKANFVNEFKARMAQRGQIAPRRRPWMLLAAAAAVVAVTLGSLPFLLREPERTPALRISQVRGTVLRLPDRVGVAAGQALLDGQGLEAQGPGSGADVVFADGTRVTLAGDTSLGRLEDNARGKQVSVSKGRIQAHVLPQPSARPMAFVMPQGIATVLGTSLRLSVDPDPSVGSKLEVEQGKVRLQNLEGKMVLVESGHRAVIAQGLALVSTPMIPSGYSVRFMIDAGQPQDVMPYSPHAIRFSPDGRFLGTITGDGIIRLWDAASGSLRHTIKSPRDVFRCLAFARDGKRIYAGGGGIPGAAGGVRVWEIETGLRIEELMARQVNTLSLSPDGRTLAGAGIDFGVELVDVATGKDRTLKLDDVIHCTAFSPDGRFVAASGRQRIVKWWDVATGQERGSEQMQVHHVVSLAFSPDGSLLAGCGGAGGLRPHIQFWDPLTGKTRPFLKELRNVEVYDIAFSPDGIAFAAGLADGTIDVWEAKTGQKLATLRDGKAPVLKLEFSPDSRTLAVLTAEGAVRFWAAEYAAK